MSKLFVANCTKQVVDFTYMIPSFKGFKHVPIRVGGQMIIGGDLPLSEINLITKQYEKYGMVKVDEIDRRKPFTGLCFDIDKPVSVAKIMRVMEHNEDVLIEQGQDIRREMALATNNQIDETLEEQKSPATLENLEMTIEQIEGTGDPQNKMEGEGIFVREDGVDPGKQIRSKTKPPQRRRASA